MRALGIDPGLVRTGWAIVENARRGSTVVAHGVITPPTDAPLPARLADGARQLRAVLAQYTPELVALEDIFTAPRHPRSALLMAHMRGAICLTLEEAGLNVIPLTATTVKQRLTGNGHASKEQVQRMVTQLTGLVPTHSMKLDETDAIALAVAAIGQTNVEAGWTGTTQPSARWAASRSSTAAIRQHVEELIRSRTARPAP